jgi:hypothetical protein
MAQWKLSEVPGGKILELYDNNLHEFMKPYKFRDYYTGTGIHYRKVTGATLTLERLIEYEIMGLSDREIAKRCRVSVAGFVKAIRQGSGRLWLRTRPANRNDKGVERKSEEHKRSVRNACQRRYHERHGSSKKRDMIRFSGRLVSEGRVIAFLILGRWLSSDEIIHHEDKNPKNNDPNNLFLFESSSDHMKYHNGEQVPYTILGNLYDKYDFRKKLSVAPISENAKLGLTHRVSPGKAKVTPEDLVDAGERIDSEYNS